MFYLKLFKTLNDYNNNKNNLLLPNISVVTDVNVIFRKKYELPYLTITALEDGLTVSFTTSCQYSLNGTDWNGLPANTITPAINTGEKIYFKAMSVPNGNQFTVSKHFNLSGNCMSMIFGDEAQGETDLIGCDNAFSMLFAFTPVVNVSPNFLPAITLVDNCYDGMFQGCTSLVTAPELPSTTLPYYCYAYMFEGCTSLVNAPELPATTLVDSCYQSMFEGCTSLNYIKMLATDISADYCLYYWVNDVSPTGTFVKSKDATWNVTGNNGIPKGWTLETA